MEYMFPAADQPLDPSWFAPLHGVAGYIRQKFRFFDPDDFTVMTRLIRPPRPSIVLYKHSITRRYLNLDDTGQAYRYIPPKGGNPANTGRYVKHAAFEDAVRHVGLWELPWMKPGLEGYRLDIDADIRGCVRRQIEFFHIEAFDDDERQVQRRVHDLDAMYEHLVSMQCQHLHADLIPAPTAEPTPEPPATPANGVPTPATKEVLRHGRLHLV